MWEAQQIYSAEYQNIILVNTFSPSVICLGLWYIVKNLVNFLPLVREKNISKVLRAEDSLNSTASFRGSSVVERSPVANTAAFRRKTD